MLPTIGSPKACPQEDPIQEGHPQLTWQVWGRVLTRFLIRKMGSLAVEAEPPSTRQAMGESSPAAKKVEKVEIFESSQNGLK